MADPFMAEVRIWATNFAPRGWAFCEGQYMPISQNTALFSLVGTTYGGNGHTTFCVPNLKGRAPMHWGTGPGLTPRVYGEFGGVSRVTLTKSQIPAHNHIIAGQASNGNSHAPANHYLAKDPAKSQRVRMLKVEPSSMVTMSPLAISAEGGGQSHENCQPYLGLNFCIATLGIYPSRN